MILVLDACTISNLIHAFQDTSLIKELRKCFSEIYISQEVLKEVQDNKKQYLSHYKNNWDILEQLYIDIRLYDYLHVKDKNKVECEELVRAFILSRGAIYKLNGEYYSSLLALYVSRDGITELNQNIRTILLATDDLKAEATYQDLFKSNQIGSIINSIDIITILYLKDCITRSRAIQYIDSVYMLYSSTLNQLRIEIQDIKKNVRLDSQSQIVFSMLLELINDGKNDKIEDYTSIPKHKKIIDKHKKIKEYLREIPNNYDSNVLSRLKERRKDFKTGLIWKL